MITRRYNVVSLALVMTLSSFLSAQVVKSPSDASVITSPRDRNAVYVEPVTLTEVYDRMGPSLNIGAVVEDSTFAAGLQKAADVWGINLDLFITKNGEEQKALVRHLVENQDSAIVLQSMAPSERDWTEILARSPQKPLPTRMVRNVSSSGYETGLSTIRGLRAELLSKIPKYDEILPIAFPISPMPDNFFQPSKFPYPRPLVRVARTSESRSATAHAHTSCNMVAQTGNMLHRTSAVDPSVFLMGMEGGNLSLKAMPGAVDPEKVSAVMTSWVMAVRGPNSNKRDILVENDGVGTSFFKPAIHAPEELDLVLQEWVDQKRIRSFERVGDDEVILHGWDGDDRRMRAGMFLIASDTQLEEPALEPGTDITGRHALDFHSTQGFLQQFVEVNGKENGVIGDARGGLLTASGATVGGTVGRNLRSLLREMPRKPEDPQPYVLSLEGGFLVVTPERPIPASEWQAKVVRIDLDLRGPLTSDQTITIATDSGAHIVL